MVFKNGTRKAGIFEQNVLVELVTSNDILDQVDKSFPEAFKQELKLYIQQLSTQEDSENYLQKKFNDP